MNSSQSEFTVDEIATAWSNVCRAVRRHVNAHGERPRRLFVGVGGAAAIQIAVNAGVSGGIEHDIAIIIVAHWDIHNTMTVV